MKEHWIEQYYEWVARRVRPISLIVELWLLSQWVSWFLVYNLNVCDAAGRTGLNSPGLPCSECIHLLLSHITTHQAERSGGHKSEPNTHTHTQRGLCLTPGEGIIVTQRPRYCEPIAPTLPRPPDRGATLIWRIRSFNCLHTRRYQVMSRAGR